MLNPCELFWTANQRVKESEREREREISSQAARGRVRAGVQNHWSDTQDQIRLYPFLFGKSHLIMLQ
jgi:hypothetical protein